MLPDIKLKFTDFLYTLSTSKSDAEVGVMRDSLIFHCSSQCVRIQHAYINPPTRSPYHKTTTHAAHHPCFFNPCTNLMVARKLSLNLFRHRSLFSRFRFNPFRS